MKIILLLLALVPWRHEESVSSSRVELEGDAIRVAFTLSAEDAAAVGGMERLFDYLALHYQVWNDGSPLRPELVKTAASPLGIVLRFPCGSPGALKIRCDAFHEIVKKPRHLVDFSDGRTVILGKERADVEWSARRSFLGETGQFAWMGIEHILTGWDHLAFLLALLVLARKMADVLKLVTAFTVAHSLTLGLTALRVIGPDASIVEPIIAASIVWVAVENLLVRESKKRWMLVFGFGLIHGMGFGGALVEMNLARPATALLGFNVGVELGQLAVVALVFPVLALLRRREKAYRTWVVRGLSGAAACAGLVWFVQRI